MENTQPIPKHAPLYLTELITHKKVCYLNRPHTLTVSHKMYSSEFFIFAEDFVQFGRQGFLVFADVYARERKNDQRDPKQGTEVMNGDCAYNK